MSNALIIRPWIAARLSAATSDNEKTGEGAAEATDGLPFTQWAINTAATVNFTLTLDTVQSVDCLWIEGANLGAGDIDVTLKDASAVTQFTGSFAIATYQDAVDNLYIPFGATTGAIKTVAISIDSQPVGTVIKHLAPGHSFTPATNFDPEPEFDYVDDSELSRSAGGVLYFFERQVRRRALLNWFDLSAADGDTWQQIIAEYRKVESLVLLSYPSDAAAVLARRNFLARMTDFIGPRHKIYGTYDLSVQFVEV